MSGAWSSLACFPHPQREQDEREADADIIEEIEAGKEDGGIARVARPVTHLDAGTWRHAGQAPGRDGLVAVAAGIANARDADARTSVGLALHSVEASLTHQSCDLPVR